MKVKLLSLVLALALMIGFCRPPLPRPCEPGVMCFQSE